jgi:hypothetical protein
MGAIVGVWILLQDPWVANRLVQIIPKSAQTVQYLTGATPISLITGNTSPTVPSEDSSNTAESSRLSFSELSASIVQDLNTNRPWFVFFERSFFHSHLQNLFWWSFALVFVFRIYLCRLRKATLRSLESLNVFMTVYFALFVGALVVSVMKPFVQGSFELILLRNYMY